MGTDIHGYIEVDTYNQRLKERDDKWEEDYELFIKDMPDRITKEQWMEKVEHRWDAVINIRPLLNRNYDLFAFFFGVRRERPDEHYGQPPVAANRGIPKDVSWLTKGDISQLDTDGHSHTWIKLSNIKNIDFSTCQGKIASFINDKNWTKLVKIMELFDDGSDNVRLVVWFDN